jgi:uncharacterized iron-regulated membrane protein
MKALKRYLFLLHRWFGVAMCLLFGLWFASGIILMYVDYPQLTEDERFAMLPTLSGELVQVTPEEALIRADVPASQATGLRLSSVLGRPAYQIQAPGRLRTVFADNGEFMEAVLPSQALEAVRYSGYWREGYSPVLESTVDIDQWTVSSSLQPHRPLYKVQLGDQAGTVLYVSSSSGQIVRDTNRNERFWNWLGSIIHWIYPVQLRRNPALWTEVVIWLSLAGMVSVITGGIIGFIRIRVRKPYKGKRMSPYRGIDKWHHVLGLWSLVFVCTFMFSGLMSMSPWGIFDSVTSAGQQINRFTGGPLGSVGSLPAMPAEWMAEDIKEVEWRRLGDQAYLVMAREPHARWAVLNHDQQGVKQPAEALALSGIIDSRLSQLLPDANLVSHELLTRYDNYYYTTHDRFRPLPVLRVKFDDPENIWYHIDLQTGEVVNRLTARGRVARWIYNGLHSLDFHFLISRRPLWDAVVILLSIIGLVFSVTSIMIGWRRLVG